MIETLNDHFRDYTFKPQISNVSKKIVQKKRMQAIFNFSHMKRTYIDNHNGFTAKYCEPKSYDRNRNASSDMHNIKLSQRKKSVNNLKMDSIFESHRMNTWLNRSLDNCTHSRLYNDAKYHHARKMHRNKMLNKDKFNGCTFQPKLVTDAKKTMKLCTEHTKKIESRNEIIK